MTAAIMLLLASCGSKDAVPGGTDTAQREAKGDTTETVAQAKDTTTVDAVTSATNVANSPTFNGLLMIAPDQQATVSSTIGGKIHSLKAMPGKAVTRGEVIAQLDNPDFIELQQTYLEASAQLEFLEQEYLRQKALGAKDAASQKRVQQSRADYLVMQSKLAASAIRLKALGISPQTIKTSGIMTYLPLKAPISGYITHLDVNLGKYVEAGTPVCEIIDKHSPLIQLTVYEKDLHLMAVGKNLEFRVNGMGKTTFSATIISIDQSVDKSDYSVKVYAKVRSTNADFRPGMYVRAKLKNS